MPRDSIVCLEWLWDSRTRVTCSGAVHRALASGGRWADGDAGGWYRVILTIEEGRRNDRPRAFLQWVEQHAADRRATVRAMIELPLSPKALSIADPVLTERWGPRPGMLTLAPLELLYV